MTLTQPLLEEIQKHPTLDEMLDRDPSGVSDLALEQLIERLRSDRALFVTTRKEKKEAKSE